MFKILSHKIQLKKSFTIYQEVFAQLFTKKKKVLNVPCFVFAMGHKRKVKPILLLLDSFYNESWSNMYNIHSGKILTWRMMLIWSGHPGNQHFTSSFHLYLVKIFIYNTPWEVLSFCLFTIFKAALFTYHIIHSL